MHERAWTLLVYMCGDNNLESSAAADLRELTRIGSTNDVAVVVQFDRYHKGEPTRRYYIEKGRALARSIVDTLGETNDGDVKTLIDFIDWGVEHYPARRYMLDIWNHGEGWDDTDVYHRGVFKENAELSRPATPLRRIAANHAVFSTTAILSANKYAVGLDDHAKDFLDNEELQKAARHAREVIGHPIDIVGMDACLMAMIEVYYQFRGNVMVGVASEETIPLRGWPYSTILETLTGDAGIDPGSFAARIVEQYAASYPADHRVTLSALNVEKSRTFVRAIDTLAAEMVAAFHDSNAYRSIAFASKNAWRSMDTPAYLDITDFADKLAGAVGSPPSLVAASRDVVRTSREFVIASAARGQSHPRGVTIWLPESPPADATIEIYKKLDFVKETDWMKFLELYWHR